MSDTPAPEPSVVEETDGPISTTDYPIEPAEEATNEAPETDEKTPAEEAPKDDEETHSDEVSELRAQLAALTEKLEAKEAAERAAAGLSQ